MANDEKRLRPCGASAHRACQRSMLRGEGCRRRVVDPHQEFSLARPPRPFRPGPSTVRRRTRSSSINSSSVALPANASRGSRPAASTASIASVGDRPRAATARPRHVTGSTITAPAMNHARSPPAWRNSGTADTFSERFREHGWSSSMGSIRTRVTPNSPCYRPPDRSESRPTPHVEQQHTRVTPEHASKSHPIPEYHRRSVSAGGPVCYSFTTGRPK